MAKTGKTSIPVAPARYRRARVGRAPESSVQASSVCKKGQPVQVSAGYITFVTGHVTAIKGFSRQDGQNGGSDGAKKSSYYLAETGIPFHFAYSGTLSESVRGLRVNLSVNSAGAPYLIYNTDSSSAGAFLIDGWDTTQWEAGDVNPEVVATIRSANVQSDN